jgi:hypothetical protein
MVKMKNVYKILVRKPERRRPLEKSRHRYKNIKIDLREIGLEDVYLIHLTQDRDRRLDPVSAVMYLRVP